LSQESASHGDTSIEAISHNIPAQVYSRREKSLPQAAGALLK
jgi:hypothetical protein